MFEISQNEIHVINPATDEKLGSFPIQQPNAIDHMLDQAEAAFKGWSRLSCRERGAYLLRVRDVIYERLEEIAQVIHDSTGKPKVEALSAELIPMLDFIPYFVKRAPKVLADKKIRLHLFVHKKSVLSYEPYGVVAVLSPWNYPFSIAVGEIVQALLAGNTVILKTSEAVLPVAKLIEDIFSNAGLPKGVLSVAYGDVKTSSYLVSSKRIKKISFTGSTGVGRKILETASKNLTPCIMELGGKDAAIVRRDANVKKAARGIVWGAFTNAGQVCASIERVFVDRTIVQEFSEAVVSETQKLQMKNDIGAITIDSQQDRYQHHLEDALRKGAKVLVGGMRENSEKGCFFQPTVLINVTPDMAVMKEETFGPLLPIMMVDSDEEAIRLTNDSAYGLGASIWTGNRRRALELSRQIEAGTITINDAVYTHALGETPWGGYKMSGGDRVHADEGLREYAQLKHLNYSRIPLTPFWWFPYTKNSYDISLALAKFLGARRWGEKAAALFKFVKGYLRH